MKKPEKTGMKYHAIGETFNDYCIIRKRELKHRQNGKPYLVLEVGDQSGRLKGRIWNDAARRYQQYPVGCIVKLRAIVQAFQSQRELKILNIRTITKSDAVRLHQLLPKSGKDLQKLQAQLHQQLALIENSYLHTLMQKLFANKSFAEAFYIAPSGKLWHHNYLGGTLEHAATLLALADVLTAHYPQVNKDLLRCGIVCHYAGKVSEYALDGYIEFSDWGRLLGYAAMGIRIVEDAIEGIDNFPEELRKKLLHLIIIHQSGEENKSGILPMTLEAVVLKHLISLDGNTNALCRITEKDALPDSRWSKYIPLLGRFVYVGKKHKQTGSQKN